MTIRVTLDLADSVQLHTGPALLAWMGDDGEYESANGTIAVYHPAVAPTLPVEPANADQFPWLHELVRQMVEEAMNTHESSSTFGNLGAAMAPPLEPAPATNGRAVPGPGPAIPPYPNRLDYEYTDTYRAAVRHWEDEVNPDARTSTAPAPHRPTPAEEPRTPAYLCECGGYFRSLESWRRHGGKPQHHTATELPRTRDAAEKVRRALGPS